MGRPKGSLNKKTVLAREALDKIGVDLLKQILGRLPQLSPQDQVKTLCELLPYVFPKLSSVEVNVQQGIDERPLKDVSNSDLDAVLIGPGHDQ